jgi:putative MATE family efflux protein
MGNNNKRKTSAMDMTTGSIPLNILKFSIPLMLAQILEVLFNMSDVAVVGKFSSYEALGAVGSTSLLVTLFTGFLIGMGCGVNVRTAQQLGAGQKENVRKTIHTSFILSLLVGIIACVLCITGAKFFLTLMNTKQELISGAVLYFRIYALGMPAMAIYNFGNAVMSASGDTKKPLIYLSFAGVVNVCLNLIFVIGIGMAEDGVAFASITAQYISAFLVVLNLFKRKDEDVCRLRVKELRLYKGVSKVILMLGIPAGIQNAIFAMANLFIQTGVNSFSAVMVSGNAAAANADALIYNVMMAFYTACSSFMGQNMGAHNKKRMLKSYIISMSYAFLAAAILGGLLIIFGRQFLSLFTSGCGSWYAENYDYGFFVCLVIFYGLYDSGIKRYWKDNSTNYSCYYRFMCIQGCLGIYNICICPYDSIPFLIVSLFMDDNSSCGNSLLYTLL